MDDSMLQLIIKKHLTVISSIFQIDYECSENNLSAHIADETNSGIDQASNVIEETDPLHAEATTTIVRRKIASKVLDEQFDPNHEITIVELKNENVSKDLNINF